MNKKIKGAVEISYNGIIFKSKSEYYCYKHLEKAKLSFSYEPERAKIWEGCKREKVLEFSPKEIPGKKGHYTPVIYSKTMALRDMTYTPDFKIIKDNYIIYLEVKGFENDLYPTKKKLFLKSLEMRDDQYKYIFIEVRGIKHILQAINIIQEL